MTLIYLAQEAGLNPKFVAQTHGGEHHCACPKCGGKDRFILQPNRPQKNCVGYYFCRQCKIFGDTIQFGKDFLNLPFNEAVLRAGGTQPERVLIPYKPTEDAPHLTTSKTASEAWLTKATEFIEQAHSNLLLQADILASLERRGIPRNAVIKYKIGWHAETQHQSGWGTDKDVWLPKGIVIPLMKQEKVTGIKIRRADYKEGDTLGKYIVVAGGSDGFSIYGKIKGHAVLATVESELDAIALQNAVEDTCCTIAIGGNNKNPTFLVDHLARKAPHLLVIPDNDDGGMIMTTKWLGLYPHARIHKVPFGKDVGEAVQQGLQLREWLSSAIPAAEATPILPEIPDIENNSSEAPASTVVTTHVEAWSLEAQVLISWFEKYIAYIEMNSPQTHSSPFYTGIKQNISEGPGGDHVETMMQNLHTLKQTIEQAPIYKTSPFYAYMVK